MNVITKRTVQTRLSVLLAGLKRNILTQYNATNLSEFKTTQIYRSFSIFQFTPTNKEQQFSQHNLKPGKHENFCTTTNQTIQTELKPPPDQKHAHLTRNLADKILQAPKSALHNIYNVVSDEFKNAALKLTPEFRTIKKSKTHFLWQCTYRLKWPEEKVFVQQGLTKQEASHKAALQALAYLKAAHKITKEGTPMMYDREKMSELRRMGKVPTLSLGESALKKVEEIVESYENGLKECFVRGGVDFVDGEEVDRKSGSFTDTVLRLPPVQKFEGLRVYKAKESVKLPISDYKDEFVDLLEKNNVVIVKGEPGCGKSTRVPQYVLEAWAKSVNSDKEKCRIIVSQPRRIAAISLASRVAKERNEFEGDIVGYQVRFNTCLTPTTRIMYCTTGILLRHIQSDPTLSNYTHILMDEAHERDVNTDLLLNLLRKAVATNPNLKLIIMSATIDTKAFQTYFNDAPTLNVPGFTHPVTSHFLGDSGVVKCAKTIGMLDGVEPYVVHEEVVGVLKHIHKKKPEGAVLCFLPGWEDISKVKYLLEQEVMNDAYVLCLHSKLQDSEQRKIFSKPPPGIRKIILATNIAETSVTVDDVVYVVDTGIHKEECFDVDKGISSVDNHWISKSSMTQRKGRAGRVQPGECYHLYTRKKSNNFAEYSTPEILRTSLTKIVLDSKVFSNNMNAVDFFNQLPSPPDESSVLKAVEELRELELLNGNEDLTPLGRILADFQLEPRLSRALVNSVVFHCVTPVVDIVTLFGTDTGIFSTTLIDKEGLRAAKGKFSKDSDHDAVMVLFETWLKSFERNEVVLAKRFCEKFNLVPHKMKTIKKLRELHFEYIYKSFRKVFPIGDAFSDSGEMVKGALLSGINTVLQHRDWSIVKGRMKLTDVFVTRHNQNATVTPDSINYKKSGKYKNQFLLYINETRSNVRRTTLIRECSLVSPFLVLLFKNNNLVISPVNNVQNDDKNFDPQNDVLLTLEGTNIRFICDRQLALKLRTCKWAVKEGLAYFVHQMALGKECEHDVLKKWRQLLKDVCELLRLVQ